MFGLRVAGLSIRQFRTTTSVYHRATSVSWTRTGISATLPIRNMASKGQTQQGENKENVANAKHTQNDASQKTNGANGKRNAKDCTQHWEDEEYMKAGQKEYENFQRKDKAATTGANSESSEEADSDQSGSARDEDQGNEDQSKKRGRGANGPNKKPKTTSGKTDGPRGMAGDKTRVPTKGQKVQWKALPGLVDGEVVEVVYEEKKVDGKSVKGSKEDPRIVLRSAASGKTAVHKPEAVYFE